MTDPENSPNNIRASFIGINRDFLEVAELIGLQSVEVVNVGRRPNSGTGESMPMARAKIKKNLDRISAEIGIKLHDLPVLDEANCMTQWADQIAVCNINLDIIRAELHRVEAATTTKVKSFFRSLLR
jgi:hypothetical protein